jgi:hypothetical protein
MLKRPAKSSPFDLFWGKRPREQGILKTFQMHIFKIQPVSVSIQGDRLPRNVAGTGCIFNCQIARSEIVRVDEDGLRAKGPALQPIRQYLITA